MTEKLNVCLMNDSFPPLIDGVVNVVTNYAEIISAGLGSVTVATPRHPEASDNFSYGVVRYRSLNITEKLCGYRMGYPFSSRALDELAAADFDIIHSHCPFASTVMARVLREKTNVPIIMTYHTKFDIDVKRALPHKIMWEPVLKFLVNNISSCDEVWTVSRGAGENLRSIGYEGDYVVMENGVDFPKGRADRSKAEALRAKYGIDDDTFLFLFVGRLLWYKGIRLILDGIKRLADSGEKRKFKMMFVGDGLDREEIEAYAKEIGVYGYCIFTGAVTDREELRVFYTAGELFLFPSDYDTNGIVVREAAACGTASLLLKGSCAAEGIKDGHSGILVNADAEDIADKLKTALSKRAEIHAFGENAMNEVYVSWDTAVKRAYDRYFTVIEKCMSGKTNRNREQVLSDEFFRMIDGITDGIQQFRGIPAEIRSRNNRVIDKLLGIEDLFGDEEYKTKKK